MNQQQARQNQKAQEGAYRHNFFLHPRLHVRNAL
ncbi:hypothetical protein GGD71_005985 [Variovorax guangxiensis]|uniref:Uncharacterized protein n=1 Tax=Variovorax guangxiensis TaxID=1775474 RepID=A0A840FRG1_9BURK|nr:hypothetical protein [Variovorax guangxiensis]